MLSHILLILGVLTFTFALRTYHHPVLLKLSAAGIFATSYLIGWLSTGYAAFGIALASTWLLLPWLELLTRTRKLSIPLDRSLRRRTPPNSHNFPALHELTDEIEGEGFEHVDDSGWDWDDHQQFFRLFYKPDEKIQAAISLIDQQEIAFYYVRISSRSKDGIVWMTWNYPFSYSLKLSPQLRVQRLRGDLTFLELLESHRGYLLQHGVAADQLEELTPELIHEEIQTELRTQIAHNVAAGVLTRDEKGGVRYSWRGLFFLWVQSLRDLVRLH